MISARPFAALVLLSTLPCLGDEPDSRTRAPLEWETRAGTRYSLTWEFALESGALDEQNQYSCATGLTGEQSSTARTLVASLALDLVAPVQSGTMPVLLAEVTRLHVTTEEHGFRLTLRQEQGAAPTARIDDLPGGGGSPDLRRLLERQRDLIIDDLAAGLRLVFPPGERPFLERAEGPIGARGGCGLWRCCYVQPAAPAVLERRRPVLVAAQDLAQFALLFPVLEAPPVYRVARQSAERVTLKLAWRERAGATEPQGGPGFTMSEDEDRRRDAAARVDFDARAGHVTRSSIAASAEVLRRSVVNGKLMSRSDERAQLRSEVRVTRPR